MKIIGILIELIIRLIIIMIQLMVIIEEVGVAHDHSGSRWSAIIVPESAESEAENLQKVTAGETRGMRKEKK